MSKCKLGVSNWTFVFENDLVVELSHVKHEVLSYGVDGEVSIFLKNATIESKIIDMFNSGMNIKELVQKQKLRDIYTNTDNEIVYTYNTIKIKRLNTVSKIGDVSVFNLVLTSKKY